MPVRDNREDFEVQNPYEDYTSAMELYGSGQTPWNYESANGGLSDRTPYGLNAIWGGTQFQNGRVSDFSHIPSQELRANQIAGRTRDELWNTYNQLAAEGRAPQFNPDQVAMNFYRQEGPQDRMGYGPAVNTAMLSEALKRQFYDQEGMGGYQTSREAYDEAMRFGDERSQVAPMFGAFEKQGQGSGRLGQLVLAGMSMLNPMVGIAASTMRGIQEGQGLGDVAKNMAVSYALSQVPSMIPGVEGLGIPKEIASPLTRAAINYAKTGDLTSSAIAGGLDAFNGSGVSSGITDQIGAILNDMGVDPSLASKLAPTVLSTLGSAGISQLTGGDPTGALVRGTMKALGALGNGVNYRASNSDDESYDQYRSNDGVHLVDDESPDIMSNKYPKDLFPEYAGLGYTPEEIKQLYEGTYSGSEQSEAQAREQMGDLYDLAYPDGFPTSSSAYEGLGYTANDIYRLMNGTYDGPQQTQAQVQEQMGSLYPLYENSFNVSAAGGTGGVSGSGGKSSGNVQDAGLNGLNTIHQTFKNDQKFDDPSKRPFLPVGISTGNAGSPLQMFGSLDPSLVNLLGRRGYAVGGEVVGTVAGPEGHHYNVHAKRGFAVQGEGTGQSDDIPTMLSDGEYVIDADTVAALGDGSSKAGAQVLDKFRAEIRKHKRSAPTNDIPPAAKSPLEYLKKAKGKKHG